MAGPTRRFLVLGLDGGTFDLLDPLMEAGELPFLASLVHRGVRAPLRSVYPAKTIPAWFSFATGRDPGELGIFGFAEPGKSPGRSKLVQSFRPNEAFWDRLSRRGSKVGVLNFPMASSYPLHGFVLPGMLSERSATFPRDLRAEVEEAIGAEYPAELPPYREQERDAWVRSATEAVERRGAAAAALATRHRPEFLFALFRETDRLEHQLWSELDRPVAQVPADLLEFWHALDRACAAVDRAFREGGGPSVTLVISDHGHGPIRSDFLTNRWLAREKLLVFERSARLALRNAVSRVFLSLQRSPTGARVSRRVADVLRDRRYAAVTRFLPGASFEAATDRIDWKRTVAYSYPVPEGIYLNPLNPELTDATREKVLEEIRARLERFPDAHIEVLPPQEIYRGRKFERAPSLFIRVDQMATEPRMDLSYQQPLIRDRPTFFYGTGTHRMDGIFIGSGDGIAPGTTLEVRRLLDVGPTILEGMGYEVPDDLSGASFASDLGLTR